MKKFYHLFLVVIILCISGCSIVNSVKSAYELTKCKFDYNRISDVSIANVKVSEGLTVSNIANLSKFLLSDFSSLPIDMIVHLDVANPSEKTASIHGCDYTINIDGLDIAEGNLNSPFEVEAGKTGIMSIRVQTDLKSVITADNRSKIVTMVKTIIIKIFILIIFQLEKLIIKLSVILTKHFMKYYLQTNLYHK